MKGIILAAGKNTLGGELGNITNKCFLPIGEYPMIYHPIHKLVESGVNDLLLIIDQTSKFVSLLGSGKRHGCSLTYKVQDEPLGIANALAQAEDFCHNERCVVALADNVFKDNLSYVLEQSALHPDWAWILLKEVIDPHNYGVACLDKHQVVSITEKPKKPLSNYAVVGFYIYPRDVFQVVKTLTPSARGQYEITDLNNYYIKQGRMGYSLLHGYWVDAGTLDSWHLANQLLRGDKNE